MPRKSTSPANYVYAILGAVLLAYLIIPILNLLPALVRPGVLEGLLRPQVLTALGISVFTATVSAALAAVFGIPLAYLLARKSFSGKWIVNLLVLLPLVLPPLISGTAILLAFSSANAVQSISQTIPGIILAQIYVASPFMIISARTAIEGVDVGYEQISHVLGKSEFETFRRITISLAKRGIIAGFLLTWVRALGELGATLVVAYVPHTISIQTWEDYLSGGIYYAIPDVILVVLITISILSLLQLTGLEGSQSGGRFVRM